MAPTVTAVPQTFTTTPNNSTSLEVLQADGAASNAPVALSSVGAVSPAGPTLTQNADGSLTFNSAATGTYSFSHTITGAPLNITPAGLAIEGYFGYSVAIEGDTAVVGSAGQPIAGQPGQGEAFVYVRQGNSWTLQQTLTAGDGGAYNVFGSAVAIRGNIIAVGAPGKNINVDPSAGAVYIYMRNGTTWTETQEIIETDGVYFDEFGVSIAMADNYMVVGAPGHNEGYRSAQGSAYIYQYSSDSGSWIFQTELNPTDNQGNYFGTSVAISGTTILVGAPTHSEGQYVIAGAANVYTLDGNSWELQQQLLQNEITAVADFGWSVSLDGDTAVIGARTYTTNPLEGFEGVADVFTRSGSTWTEQQELQAPDASGTNGFGTSVVIDGNTVLIGSDNQSRPPKQTFGGVYEFTYDGSTWVFERKIVSPGGPAFDEFVQAVALDGDTALIGEPLGPTTNGTGLAYFLDLSQSTETVTVNVVSQDVIANDDNFNIAINTPTDLNVLANDLNPQGTGLQVISATSVSPSGPTLTQNPDGSFTFTSPAPGTYTFDYSITGAQQEVTANDGAAGDNFGDSVAISGDTAVVGAAAHTVNGNADEGAVYLFTLTGSGWTFQQELTAPDGTAGTEFGGSIAISGTTLVVGAIDNVIGGSGPGAAYVYTFSGGAWTLQQELTAADGAAGDAFGYSVAISGDTLVVGAPNHEVGSNTQQGAAYVYTFDGQSWTQPAELISADGASSDRFGTSVAVNGDTMVVGALLHAVNGNANQGAAYIFTVSYGIWAQQQELTADDGLANDEFGNSVAMSGNTIAIGAFDRDSGQGAAYVYILSGLTWTQQQELTAADGVAGDNFGQSVALDGNYLLIGAAGHAVGSNNAQGAAYVYTSNGSNWNQQSELSTADGVANAFFGVSVALSGDTAMVGANSQTIGANADQGAAYLQDISVSSANVTVNVNPPREAVFVSGNGQITRVSTQFANPLVVEVTDANGDPLLGVPVTFAGPSSGPGVTFPFGNVAITNSQGEATILVDANSSGGSYTVTASVAGVALPATFALTNGAIPTITQQAGSQVAAEGRSATFSAAAIGPPTPSVQWEISTNGGATFTAINGATSDVLTLSDITLAMDGDEYEAVFTNSYGTTSTNAVTLTVPRITAITSTTENGTYELLDRINVTVNFNEPVNLTGGDLIVGLNNGGVVSIAPFTNSRIASGTYVIGPGQNTSSLDTTTVVLAAGATLKDGEGNVPDLGIPLGQSLANNAAFAIDTDPPVIASVNPPAVADGATVSFTLSASSPDDAPLRFSLGSDAPAGASINAQTGMFTWTPSEFSGQAPGVYPLTVIATDTRTDVSTASHIAITVVPTSTDQGLGVGARMGVAEALADSAEYYQDLVTGAYNKFLDRAPDASGLPYWVNLMQSGLSDELLEAKFVSSQEYLAKYAGPGPAWVKAMYVDLLDRSPAASEVQYWLNRMGSGVSTLDVALGFANSQERRALRVQADYVSLIGRTANQSEISYWAYALQNGATNEHVTAGLLSSPEFFQSHGNNTTDWLFAAYRVTLSRELDSDGYQAWMSQLG